MSVPERVEASGGGGGGGERRAGPPGDGKAEAVTDLRWEGVTGMRWGWAQPGTRSRHVRRGAWAGQEATQQRAAENRHGRQAEGQLKRGKKSDCALPLLHLEMRTVGLKAKVQLLRGALWIPCL